MKKRNLTAEELQAIFDHIDLDDAVINEDDRRSKIGDHFRGSKLSDDHKTKVSAGLIGHEVSDDARRKMSEAKKGSTHTENAKDKISARMKVVANTDERKAAVSAVHTGRKDSKEVNDRRRASQPNRRRVRVHGVTYESIQHAAKATGELPGNIHYRAKTGKKGYKFLD